MGEGGQADLAALLRARLAAAGLEPPPGDTSDLERDLALHLERVAALAAAADLLPSDPPLPDPTTATGPEAVGPGGVDNRGTSAPGSATLRWPYRSSGEGGVDLGRPGWSSRRGWFARGRSAASSWSSGRSNGSPRSTPTWGRSCSCSATRLGRRRRSGTSNGGEGEAGGTLHGVPVAVKDLIDVEGVVTGAGSVKLAGNRAGRDAGVVARLRGAGAVVVGKTRTHEFAYGVTTPGTANPWDLERIAGGSSGGSAAAVAAGLVAGALGSDTAGSIRIPSSCCGVVGLKPTWGRVPATGVWPLSWSCDHVGPIAATVADVALLDEVLAGEPGGEAGPAGDAPRIGRVVGDDLGPVDPAVAGMLDELCRRMEAAGATVDEVVLPLQAARGAVGTIVLAEAAAAHVRLLAETGEDGYSRAMLAMIRIGRSALAGEYLTGLRYRGRFVAQVEGLLAGRDALLAAHPAVRGPAGR